MSCASNPPSIVGVNPADGATDVSRSATPYAIFNKAMDKPSAEAAFSLKRTSDGAAVSGSFGWYGNALIFKPDADLAAGTQYTASVSTAAKDLAGNPLPAAKTWRFTTTNPPSIVGVNPADGATDVSRSATPYAIFNKAMDKPSAEAAFSLKRTSDGAAVSGSFGWYGNALIFKPDADLAAGTQYTASVSTAAKDLAGNPLPAAKTWRFTTTNPPSIVGVNPADGATDVSRSATPYAIFNKAMDKPSAEAAFSLKRTSDGAAVSGSFGWYGNALIFKPDADLAAGTQYTASVSTAAKDLAGNPLPAAKTWRFTTTNPPSIVGVNPADGATDVSRSATPYAIFNKAMDKPSAEAAFSLKRTSDGAAVSGSFGWYGNALIFKPDADLAAGTQYTASVSTAAKDLAGNPLPAAKTWRFTTTNPPSIVGVNPADGATDVSRSATPYAIFNKAMDKPSAEAAFSLKRTSDGAAVSGSFGWYGNALIFKPDADLAAGTQYTASVSTAAKDLKGNALANPVTWSYATAPSG